MVNERDALAIWVKLLDGFQPATPLKHGLMGDGAGRVEVEGETGWSWIRYDQQPTRVSKVRCYLGVLEEGTWVIVGKWRPEDDYEQVLAVYFGPYDRGMTDEEFAYHKVPRHGDTHHGTYGSDPAWIDYSNITFGRVTPTDPYSLTVWVEAFVYGIATEVKDFEGVSLDLSAEVPGIVGHKYTLVYFNLDTETVGYTSSSVVPLAVAPTYPTLADVSAVPLAIVDLYNGQTEITFDNVWQRKLMLGNIGGNVPPHIHDTDASGGASLIGVQELMFDCASSLPIIAGHIYPTDVYHELFIEDPGLYTHDMYVNTDLSWIHADLSHECGHVLVIRPAEPGLYKDYTITVRHGVGNISLYSGEDVVLNDNDDHMFLIYNGTNWCDMAHVFNPSSLDAPLTIGDVASGNYLEIEADGTMVFHGDGTVWEDLRVSLDVGKTGANAPNWQQFRDDGAASNGVYAWQFDDGEQIWFAVQFEHAWKEGDTVYPHVHWSPSSDVDPSDNIGIGLEYTWANIWEDFPLTTIVTRDVPTGANTHREHRVHNFAEAGIDATGKTISSVMHCRFFRQAASADNYGDPIWAHYLDFHIKRNMLGSREIASK